MGLHAEPKLEQLQINTSLGGAPRTPLAWWQFWTAMLSAWLKTPNWDPMAEDGVGAVVVEAVTG